MQWTQRLYKKIGAFFTKPIDPSRAYLCDFDYIIHELRPADVVLVEGRNRISHIIQRVTLSPWSHAALYIGRLNDIEDPYTREQIQQHYTGKPSDQLVIETIVGLGTVINNIKRYEEDHIRICRPTGLAHRDAQFVITHALKNLAHHYDVRQFLDLGRFLLRSKIIPPKLHSSLFDYTPGQATRDVCSTVIAEAFMSVKFPILPLIHKDGKSMFELIHRNPRLFTPSDFDYSPYFDIIKYPVFHIGQQAHYRSLPWNSDYYSNDELGIKAFTKPEAGQPE